MADIMDTFEIAYKMKRCRKAAKILFDDRYEEKIEWYIRVLKAVMEKENLTELQSVLFVSKLESVKDNAGAIMMFTAAALEIIEQQPKPPTP